MSEATDELLVVIDGNWKRHAVRGAAALAFGVLTLVWPGLTVLVLVALFGAFALIDGATHASALFTLGRRNRPVPRSPSPSRPWPGSRPVW